MAIVLTYASIVSTYVPMLAQDPEAAATSPLVLFLMAATIPFLTPFVATGQGLIGLLILAFALYEAWRQNRRPLMAFAGPFQVALRVRDHGPGSAAPDPDGHGLLGMRERATMVGGTLTAGPADGGGFVVEAELPITGGTS